MPSKAGAQLRKSAGLCITCGKEKVALGLVQCRKCLDKKKQYAKENVEHIRQLNKQYHHDRYQSNPLPEIARTYKRRLKAQCIFGGKCAVCGNDDFRVLEFDHKVDGDGKVHRQEIGASTSALANWVLRNHEQAKDRLELLCANCHAIKHAYSRKFAGYLEPWDCAAAQS